LKDFPEPVVAAIKALDSAQRRKILIYLEESGSLTYTEILKKTGLHSGTLNFHLKILLTGAIIRKHHDRYYQMTKLAFNVIEELRRIAG